MKRRVLLLSALAAFAAPVAAQAAMPQSVPMFEQVQDRRGGQDAGPRVSLNEIVRRLRSSRQGQMVDARPSNMGGRAVYIIVWEYPGGRIGNIYVDQASGQVLRED